MLAVGDIRGLLSERRQRRREEERMGKEQLFLRLL